MNNTCSIRVTAAAGTNLAGTSTYLTFIIFRKKSGLQWKKSPLWTHIHMFPNRGLLDHTYQYIVQYSLLLPIKFGSYCNPVVADRSSKPAKHCRLGQLLPWPTTIILYDPLKFVPNFGLIYLHNYYLDFSKQI